MSKWEKLIKSIIDLSADLRFEELKKILEHYGYKMKAPSNGSSHCTFRKDGKMPVTIPKKKPIKRVYVELVKQIVEEEMENEDS